MKRKPSVLPKLDCDFYRKMHQLKTELGCVFFDPQKKAFVHVEGRKKGHVLSLSEMEEMSRRSNLYNELQWALYKLDDKPWQSWSRLLQMAMRNQGRSSIISCLILFTLSLTPQETVGLLGKKIRDALIKSLRQRMRLHYYGDEYKPYISAAIKELKAIKFDRHGKMKMKGI